MVAAVGTSTSFVASNPGAGSASGGSKAGLEAQLDTYKKQLCDWVTCASAKTPEGKKKIEDLTAKVATTESRIKDMDKMRDARTASADVTNPQHIKDANAIEARRVEAAARTSSTGAGPGSLVDVLA